MGVLGDPELPGKRTESAIPSLLAPRPPLARPALAFVEEARTDLRVLSLTCIIIMSVLRFWPVVGIQRMWALIRRTSRGGIKRRLVIPVQ